MRKLGLPSHGNAPTPADRKRLAARERAGHVHAQIAAEFGPKARQQSSGSAVESALAGALPDHQRQRAVKAEPILDARVKSLNPPLSPAAADLLSRCLPVLDATPGENIDVSIAEVARSLSIGEQAAFAARHELVARGFLSAQVNALGGPDGYRVSGLARR